MLQCGFCYNEHQLYMWSSCFSGSGPGSSAGSSPNQRWQELEAQLSRLEHQLGEVSFTNGLYELRIENFAKVLFASVMLPVIQSGNKLALVTAAQLSCHEQICHLIWSLVFKQHPYQFLQDMDFSLIKYLSNWSLLVTWMFCSFEEKKILFLWDEDKSSSKFCSPVP